MDYPQYDPASAITPLTAAELDGLDQQLQTLQAEAGMSLDGADGYLTALQVGPPQLLATLATADWLPVVWGGDGPGGTEEAAPFASKRQRKATVVLLLRHLRHLAALLADQAAVWEPIFSIAEQGDVDWVDARDWCTGFLQGVDLMPDAWGDVFKDPALTPLLQLGGGLPGLDTPALPEDADLALIDRLSRTVPDAVLQLRQRLRPVSTAV